MKRILIALVLGISLLFASGGFVYAQDYGRLSNLMSGNWDLS